MSHKDLICDITKRVQAEGYKMLQVNHYDFGETIKLVVEKDGVKSLLPIRECFYDTDDEGNRTEDHGVVDIRESLWYQEAGGNKCLHSE